MLVLVHIYGPEEVGADAEGTGEYAPNPVSHSRCYAEQNVDKPEGCEEGRYLKVKGGLGTG